MSQSDSKVTKQRSPTSLTEEQIVTDRKFPRRAFLTAASALIAGGAALVSYGADPDQADRTKSRSPKAAGAPDADRTDRTKSSSAKTARAPDADQTDRKKSRSRTTAGAADADRTDRSRPRP
jgi:hypothetical protein